MSFHVYAITRADGPVIVESCATEAEQNRAYHHHRHLLVTGGYDPADVADIAKGHDRIARAEEADRMYEALTQGVLL